MSAARGVIVRPVGAVRRYAGKAGAIGVDPIRAARELGVGWVLEGTIAQRGERLRVTARLLDVRNGSAAWSDSFDETFTHVFDVQETISRRVAAVLMPRLDERERGALGVAGTRSVETYRLYLEARYLSQLLTPDAYRRSIVLYEQAIAADPRCAYAWYGLADALRRRHFTSNTPPRQTFERMRAAAQPAVEIDPRYGDGWAMLGWVVYLFDWDWPRSSAWRSSAPHRTAACRLKPSMSAHSGGVASQLGAAIDARCWPALEGAQCLSVRSTRTSPALTKRSSLPESSVAATSKVNVRPAACHLKLSPSFSVTEAPVGPLPVTSVPARCNHA